MGHFLSNCLQQSTEEVNGRGKTQQDVLLLCGVFFCQSLLEVSSLGHIMQNSLALSSLSIHHFFGTTVALQLLHVVIIVRLHGNRRAPLDTAGGHGRTSATLRKTFSLKRSSLNSDSKMIKNNYYPPPYNPSSLKEPQAPQTCNISLTSHDSNCLRHNRTTAAPFFLVKLFQDEKNGPAPPFAVSPPRSDRPHDFRFASFAATF